MSDPISFREYDLNLVASMDESIGVPDADMPFRVAILGDFSGRASRSVEAGSLRNRSLIEVDRDNLDEVIQGMGVELNLRLWSDDSPPVVIRFAGLEDFHPDSIFERLDVFQVLRQTRQKLSHPSTFASAAAEVRSWGDPDLVAPREQTTSVEQNSASLVSDFSTRDLLEQMLSETKSKDSLTTQPAELTGFSQFLRDIVEPHLVARDDEQKDALISAVDDAISKMMRSILHHPDFQAVESAWRAVHFMTSRVETDTKLKLYLLDLGQGELAADIYSAEELRKSSIYRLLVEQETDAGGREPWAVLVGNYTFEPTREDAVLLGGMASVARQSGAPFIASASPRILGCDSLAESPDPDDWQSIEDAGGDLHAWTAMRRLPDARYLGLTMPRFLLRLPYGKETEPTELFDFEEMAEGEPPHESYLWGNPSFVCAYLLAEAFSQSGWDMRPGEIQDIEDLPLHVYESQGESLIKPCGEVRLTEWAAEKILDQGVMPLLSFRDSDKIRIPRFQSLADPPTPLAGRWT